MEVKRRLTFVLIITLLLWGIFFSLSLIINNNIESEMPEIYQNDYLKISSFLDDFIRVQFSCFGNATLVSFQIIDENNNIFHNSTSYLSCNEFNKIDLQCSPKDCQYNKKYKVIAGFNNKSISSDYFYFKEPTRLSLARTEIVSFFSFMIIQNRMARACYSDQQRLLYSSTKDIDHGEKYILVHFIGVLSTFTIFLTIDIILWLIYFIRKKS